jgi:hypothetical protein
MNHVLLRGGRYLAVLAVLTLTAAIGTLPTRADPKDANNGNNDKNTVTAYSGRAFALKIDGITSSQPGPIVIADTGPLPSAGGTLEVSDANVNLSNGAMTIGTADSLVTGVGPQTLSESNMANYHVEFITHDGVHVFIDADFIGATATASVSPSGKVSTAGSVNIQGLKVDGKAITVTGAPNQIVEIPDAEAKLIINEQVSSGDGSSGDIAVSAIHFYICECIEGHYGLVTAGISGGKGTPPPAGDCGKLTGGGWIPTSTGAKASFAVSGGIRDGAYWGHLNYIDHGTGMHVESSGVTGFKNDPQSATGRIITYAVTIDGKAGTATVRAVDNGEPGRNDIFEITLSTGYHEGSDLGGSHPGGGNIQLHKCPPGWE